MEIPVFFLASVLTNFKHLGAASVSIDLGAKAPTTNFKRLGAASVSIDLGAKAPTKYRSTNNQACNFFHSLKI